MMEDFAQHARNETNLKQLSDQLVLVVQETMQPEKVSVWLKPTEIRKKTVHE